MMSRASIGQSGGSRGRWPGVGLWGIYVSALVAVHSGARV